MNWFVLVVWASLDCVFRWSGYVFLVVGLVVWASSLRGVLLSGWLYVRSGGGFRFGVCVVCGLWVLICVVFAGVGFLVFGGFVHAGVCFRW